MRIISVLLLCFVCFAVVSSTVGCITNPEVRAELKQYQQELIDLKAREEKLMAAFKDGSITYAELTQELKLLWQLKDRVEASVQKLRSEGVGVKDILFGVVEVLLGAFLGYKATNRVRDKVHPRDIALADLQ